jgi:hypothetical protein
LISAIGAPTLLAGSDMAATLSVAPQRASAIDNTRRIFMSKVLFFRAEHSARVPAQEAPAREPSRVFRAAERRTRHSPRALP